MIDPNTAITNVIAERMAGVVPFEKPAKKPKIEDKPE